MCTSDTGFRSCVIYSGDKLFIARYVKTALLYSDLDLHFCSGLSVPILKISFFFTGYKNIKLLLKYNRNRNTNEQKIYFNPKTANHYTCRLLCHLLVILKVIFANSVDPDQIAPLGAVSSGSTLYAKIGLKS